MNKAALMQITTHLTDSHMQNKSIYLDFIKRYAEYYQTHVIPPDLMKKYSDIFLACNICGEYFNFYQAHLSLLEETTKPKIPLSKIDHNITNKNNQAIDMAKFNALFPHRPLLKESITGEIKQIAAAGTQTAHWFTEPIDFKALGVLLDIRRIKKDPEKVSIYLKPSQKDYHQPATPSEIKKIQQTLHQYAGKTMGLIISNNQQTLLEASIYISQDATEGDGSGVLLSNINPDATLHIEIIAG